MTLEGILGQNRYQAYVRGELKGMDIRSLISVTAELEGWDNDFDNFTKATVGAINFGEVIKWPYLQVDNTNFRVFFTCLYAIGKLSEEHPDAQGLTAHIVSAYTNINVHSVYTCLKMLAYQEFLKKDTLKQTDNWKALSGKIRAHDRAERDAKLFSRKADLASERIEDFKLARLNYSASRAKMFEGSDFEFVPEKEVEFLRKREEELASQVRKWDGKLASAEEASKSMISPSKREAYGIGNYDIYSITDAGKGFLELARQAFTDVCSKIDRLWSSLGISHDLEDRAAALLKVAHISQENAVKLDSLFREKYLVLNQLPSEQIVLCNLYSAEFRIGTENVKKLVYAGGFVPKQEQDVLVAQVRVAPRGELISAETKEGNFGIGVDSERMLISLFSDTEKLVSNTSGLVTGNLSAGHRLGLKRLAKPALALDDQELDACGVIGIAYNKDIVPFDTYGVESVGLGRRGPVVEIPEAYRSGVILFLPGHFDPSRIKRAA